MFNYFNINVWHSTLACFFLLVHYWNTLYTVLCILYVTSLHSLYDFFFPIKIKKNNLNGSRTTVLDEESMCLCMHHMAVCMWCLHFVNGTVTSRYYLNNINDVPIGSMHEWHRPDHIFMDNPPALQGHICWSGLPLMEWPVIFSREESHEKKM